MPSDVIEGEIVDETGRELARVEAQSPTLFGTDDPATVVEKAAAAAEPLAAVVRKQKLTTRISGREYCRVEAWTLLGSMLGVFPVCVWTRKLDDGWEARVEARTRDGAIVGAAEAECLYTEKTWKGRDDYALRSMAQTRATSKALRQPLGFVMTLAGFEATPAEEMPREPRETKAARTDRLRERLLERAEEADQIRGCDLGTTWAEINAKLGEKPSEDELVQVGLDVADWIAAGCLESFALYKPVPF